MSKLVSVKVDLNMLGQVCESAEARADELEADFTGMDVDVVAERMATATWIRACVEHVQTARENAKAANGAA